jgi:hypothetical protein
MCSIQLRLEQRSVDLTLGCLMPSIPTLVRLRQSLPTEGVRSREGHDVATTHARGVRGPIQEWFVGGAFPHRGILEAKRGRDS